MGVYYSRANERHPIFDKKYREWAENSKNQIKLIPDTFNLKYNEYRAVLRHSKG